MYLFILLAIAEPNDSTAALIVLNGLCGSVPSFVSSPSGETYNLLEPLIAASNKSTLLSLLEPVHSALSNLKSTDCENISKLPIPANEPVNADAETTFAYILFHLLVDVPKLHVKSLYGIIEDETSDNNVTVSCIDDVLPNCKLPTIVVLPLTIKLPVIPKLPVFTSFNFANVITSVFVLLPICND